MAYDISKPMATASRCQEMLSRNTSHTTSLNESNTMAPIFLGPQLNVLEFSPSNLVKKTHLLATRTTVTLMSSSTSRLTQSNPWWSSPTPGAPPTSSFPTTHCCRSKKTWTASRRSGSSSPVRLQLGGVDRHAVGRRELVHNEPNLAGWVGDLRWW